MALVTVPDYQAVVNKILLALARVGGYHFPYRDLLEVGVADADIASLRATYETYLTANSGRPLNSSLPHTVYGDPNSSIVTVNQQGRSGRGITNPEESTNLGRGYPQSGRDEPGVFGDVKETDRGTFQTGR